MVQPVDFAPADDRRDEYNPRLCGRCQKRESQASNPRQRMSRTHALEVVRSILIQRLDDRLSELTAIALAVAADHIPDVGTAESLAVAYIQRTQLALFPEEFGPGPVYVPDPAGRMDAVPSGLVPKLSTVAIYAHALLAEERAKAAGKLKMPDGSEVLSDTDLLRLRDRRAARERKHAAAV